MSETLERYKRLKSHWEDWSKNPDTFEMWIPPPGDLAWLFDVFIPALTSRIAALQEFQYLYEREVASHGSLRSPP